MQYFVIRVDEKYEINLFSVQDTAALFVRDTYGYQLMPIRDNVIFCLLFVCFQKILRHFDNWKSTRNIERPAEIQNLPRG